MKNFFNDKNFHFLRFCSRKKLYNRSSELVFVYKSEMLKFKFIIKVEMVNLPVFSH